SEGCSITITQGQFGAAPFCCNVRNQTSLNSRSFCLDSWVHHSLARAGYEVRAVKKGEIAGDVSWADVIVLAIPFGAVQDVARELKTAADGKIVVDVTNALTPEMQLAMGFTTSGAEELQKALPRAHVVKS
ncbi:NAD(P)-binding domain-containing protein, partial [Acidithiobacillus thiooxidans]|uniref:NAD(P)-binding domain-containing protein n=1 Tax=Acidithiobacillus thiooxidans TaxID=930 RepID=UPI000B0CCC9A